MLDTMMKQLAEELEIEGSFATEVPGVYAFPVEEDVNVLISEIPRGFSMTCTAIECPEGREEEFFVHALFGNLYGHGTDGSILGLDAEGKNLTLSREVDYSVDYKEFRDMVEDFLNSVDIWRAEAQAYNTKVG